MTEKKNKFINFEEETLKFWNEKKIFEKSLAKESPQGDYVFYDGPPFATGTPHYGHIVASLMKDAVPRFWTMNGYRVERRWGWDCHGLPIENIVEKEMNILSKKQIEDEIGIEKFNASCRSKVLMYADEWKKFIPRMGRWVDMENAYKTMDPDFMESIWWVFKQLWDNKYIYEGHKSMHICPRCETTLSQSEVSQGYKEVKDISVIAKFKLLDEDNTYILAWTTTPWTLPGNVALAVGNNIYYVKVKADGVHYILAKDVVEKIFGDKPYEIIENLRGMNLLDKAYEPLFPYFDNPNNREKGFHVYDGDFVITEEGTGIVHIAPAFGEDDMKLGQRNNLPFIQHVDSSGHMQSEVVDFAGQSVKPSEDPQVMDIKILKWLAEHDKLFSKEKYTHTYPHCWRCDSPLLNYATSSWFVNVTAMKEKMIKLAEEINWVPAHIKHGRFGKWLDGAQDWSISRQRFWGSVLPIWRCDKCQETQIFGSKQELEQRTNQTITDLHKDQMDKIVYDCDKCSGVMRRIPDVLDCWFESGSMPYAQMHYPIENKEKFEANFPAEFIAEGVDQTRCWFYYLLVLATGVKAKIPFKNVIANGIVLAEDGQKMSKRLRNYPDPNQVINKYGADALRYYLLTSPVMKGDTLLFSEKVVDEVFKKLIMILENVLTFYKMYATSGIVGTTNSTNVIDRWILAKLEVLKQEVTNQMRAYDLVLASRPIIEFVSELSTWYLRRSRDRFKSADLDDKNNALSTMAYVLNTLSKILAPFTPFTAERLYQQVFGSLESVHLEAWPTAQSELINESLLSDMKKIREAVEKGLALREEAKIKVRQPLNNLQIIEAVEDENLLALLKAEVNVKNISIGSDYQLDTALTPELVNEGLLRELVRAINAMRKKLSLTIADKALVTYQTNDVALVKIIKDNLKYLMAKTKTQEFIAGPADQEVKINDKVINLKIDKV
ncbi:MAG: isoleucine--tRNA ligase [Patescibacteria group bacterium]